VFYTRRRTVTAFIAFKKWAANQSILRGVKALAIELGLESEKNQMITVNNLWFTIKNEPIILSVLFYERGLTPDC
jgi:hypothetical protein